MWLRWVPDGSDPVRLNGHKRGHNLLEVMIAAIIFSTACLLFLGVWSSFYSAQSLSRSRLAAASLARAVMEQKIAAGFYSCEPATPDTDPIAQGEVNSKTEIRGKTTDSYFKYYFYSKDNGANTFRKLTVHVIWRDRAGGDKTLTYETHLYRTN